MDASGLKMERTTCIDTLFLCLLIITSMGVLVHQDTVTVSVLSQEKKEVTIFLKETSRLQSEEFGFIASGGGVGLGICGDGSVGYGEDCEEDSDCDAGEKCSATCKCIEQSVCGNNVCDQTESCDLCFLDCDVDGNGDSGACCGDNVAQGTEECDDGANGNNTDQCYDTCEFTVCGDNIQQDLNGEGVEEECDGTDIGVCVENQKCILPENQGACTCASSGGSDDDVGDGSDGGSGGGGSGGGGGGGGGGARRLIVDLDENPLQVIGRVQKMGRIYVLLNQNEYSLGTTARSSRVIKVTFSGESHELGVGDSVEFDMEEGGGAEVGFKLVDIALGLMTIEISKLAEVTEASVHETAPPKKGVKEMVSDKKLVLDVPLVTEMKEKAKSLLDWRVAILTIAVSLVAARQVMKDRVVRKKGKSRSIKVKIK